jgi:hypothetical protein
MSFDIKFVDSRCCFYSFILQEREWVFVFIKYLLQIVEKDAL